MPSLHTKDNCNGCSVFADDNNMIHSSRFILILQSLQRYFAVQKTKIIMKNFDVYYLLLTLLVGYIYKRLLDHMNIQYGT